VIVSLIIGKHDATPVSDPTMERHQASTIDPPPVRQRSLSDRDWDKCGGTISVDAWSAASMISGASPRDGGVTTSGRDSVDSGICRPSDSLRNRLQAIRRRLWILNATLESLPAKVELVSRQSGVLAGEYGPDQRQDTRDEPGDERLALKGEGALSGWRARWKLARLRSRADRAERRAAVAIHDASASFGAALEAVLHAAIARVKADEAGLNSCRPPTSRRCD
jgi:hypothetical protein